MTAMWPTVSVVVPTFRRPGPLGRCLQSLAQLDYPRDRLEVIVVDDGGHDLSPADLTDLAPGVGVRLLVQPANSGPAAARNRGAREGSGTLVAFTDDDCRPQPAWLRDLATAVEEEPSALVGGRVDNALGNNLFAVASQDLVSYLIDYFPKARSLRPFFTSNNMACRQEAFLRLGGFDETFRFSAGEDRDLSERWAAEIGPLRHLAGAVVDHHHDLNIRRFVRQHHYYGRGAVHLARGRRRRGKERPLPERFSFYAGMLAAPVRRHGWRRGSWVAGLTALSQVATLTGMFTEIFWPSLDDGPRSPPD